MIFCGIFDAAGGSIGLSEQAEMSALLSRKPDDVRNALARPGFFVVSTDFAWSPSAITVVEDAEGISLVVGRALLAGDEHVPPAEELRSLGRAMAESDVARLSMVRGSFCALHFSQAEQRLALCVDKVGVLPIYYAVVGSRVYFSSVLRVLEGFTGVEKRPGLEQLAQIAAFNYPLGRSTAYENIFTIYGGELLVFHDSRETSTQYWRWDQVAARPSDEEALLGEVYDKFIDAVRVRSDSSTPGDLAFLSGGLDSRCIVGGLRNLGRDVWSLNFAPEGSQDHLFGRMAAEALGIDHFELQSGAGSFMSRQKTILDAWSQAHPVQVKAGASPYRVWSGDGGSVCMGHVYLDESFISLARSCDLEGACRYFLKKRKHGVPRGIFQSGFDERVARAPLEGMLAEMQSFKCQDPGKACLLFLLLNDQRRHLAGYIENLDECRFEMELPFFDGKLLELIVAAPLDYFILHRFYNKWLKRFGRGLAEVPWQAYPGHAPCTVALKDAGSLRYQWEEGWFDKEENRLADRRDLDTVFGILTDSNFASDILCRRRLWLTYLLTRYKIRDYKYVLNTLMLLQRFLRHRTRARSK